MTASTLRDQLRQKRVEIEKLQRDVERCDASAATGDEHRQAVNDLKKQRETVVAQAFLDGVAPETKKLDKQISDAEQAHRAAIELGAAATNAKRLLADKISATEEVLLRLEEQNASAINESVSGMWAGAVANYSKAFDNLVDALVGMREVALTISSLNPSGTAMAMTHYDVLIREINRLGIVSAPPVYRAPAILDHRVTWEERAPHAIRIAEAIEKTGVEMPSNLPGLVAKATA